MTKDQASSNLRKAQASLDYHNRSISHTFSNNRGEVNIETQRWMMAESRRLEKILADAKKDIAKKERRAK